jgi:HlyD family secretion protein
MTAAISFVDRAGSAPWLAGGFMVLRIVVVVLVIVALGGLLAYSQWQTAPLKVSGFVEADEIRVGSRVGGRVARVHVTEGQRVRAGEPLVELEEFDLAEREAESRAVLAGRQADLDRLLAGYRLEEIAQAKARVDQLAARVERLRNGPRTQEKEAARAQLVSAEAQSELARQIHATTQKLFDRMARSREELDQAIKELTAAQAMVDVRRQELALLLEGTRREEIDEAEAQLREATEGWKLMTRGFRREEVDQARASRDAAEAALKALQIQRAELVVAAPVDGVIEALELQKGDLVSAGAPVLSLMDTSNLWVRAYLPEDRLDVKIGQFLPVTVDSYPGEEFSGEVTFISRQAEFTPTNVQTPEERVKQVFRIKVTIRQGKERMRPGMSADVWLKSREPARGPAGASPLRPNEAAS